MTFGKFLAATAATALLTAGAASAQMFGDEYGTDLTPTRFNEGFSQTGYYEAWDQNDDDMLDQDEFTTGIYADWDADNDNILTEDEFTTGAERWGVTDTDFSTLDADGDGEVVYSEFNENWDNDAVYSTWDGDDDGLLNNDEFSTGLYDSADLDSDQVITVEEEGWFEGWFDGDDIEAEIQNVNEV